LNFDYEVRSSKEAFDDVPALKIEGEMLDLAKHIINTKKGSFDVKAFDDRYDQAVAELVKAKIEGRVLPKKKAPPARQGQRPAAGPASERRVGIANQGQAACPQGACRQRSGQDQANRPRQARGLIGAQDGLASVLEGLPQAVAGHLSRADDPGDLGKRKGALPHAQPPATASSAITSMP
jgi:hypothetical protein